MLRLDVVMGVGLGLDVYDRVCKVVACFDRCDLI